MRNIVIFLLLLNVIYFVWALFKPVTDGVNITRPSSQSDENSLVLVSELASMPVTVELNNNLPYPQSAIQCFSIGDFQDLSDANEFRDQVIALGLEPTLNIAQNFEQSLYQVYLPPISSPDLAANVLQEINNAIRAADLSIESQLITSGNLQNSITFGRYDSPDEAQIKQSQLAELGYVADVEQIPGEESVIRVLLRTNQNAAFEAQIWPEIQIQRQYLGRTENLCETIAQGEQFP